MTGPLRAELEVIELEAGLLARLADAGWPADLTRLPHPWEVTTSFGRIDDLVNGAASEVGAAALRIRSTAVLRVLAMVAHLQTPAAILAALDSIAAGASTLPGAAELRQELRLEARARLSRLGIDAAQLALDDARRNGLAVGAVAPARAAIAVDVQASRIAAEALESALRAVRGAAYSTARTGRGTTEFLADVAAAADKTSTRGLLDIANQGALNVFGAGRQDGLGAISSPARWYASELLDRNTCAPCSWVDGKEYSSLSELRRDYPDSGYVSCLGGERCRGTPVVISRREAAPTLQVPGDRRVPAAPIRRPEDPAVAV